MKMRLLRFFLSCLWALLYPGHSYAESPDDFIYEHLVTFSPPISEGDNHYPCQGIRVRPSILFTSNNCVHLITKQLLAGKPIEALDIHRIPLGKVKLFPNMDEKKGFLGLDTSKAYVNPDQRYPVLHDKPLRQLSPAKAFYQPLSDGEIQQVVMVMLIYHKSDSHHHYIINANEPLPAGAPIVHNGKVVCTVTPGAGCKAPVLLDKGITGKINQDCHDSLPEIYFFPGCVNRTITSCSENVIGFAELTGQGTCINSMSGETCTFSTDQQHHSDKQIYSESITCPSCNANYFNDGAGHHSNTCTPKMCMKGCTSESRSDAMSELINAMHPENSL